MRGRGEGEGQEQEVQEGAGPWPCADWWAAPSRSPCTVVMVVGAALGLWSWWFSGGSGGDVAAVAPSTFWEHISRFQGDRA